VLREALELVEDTRARLVLNVSEELACEALAYRLERLLAA
jgi:DNA polymerase III subunit delta'